MDGGGVRPVSQSGPSTPAVLLDRVDPSIGTWIRDRLVPKVLVASQTRVIEAIVDVDGRCVPCTPVVSVEPCDDPSVWHLAALLTSPVATAWLVTEAAGTALSASAVRVSAATLAALPLPDDQQAWDIAAEAARNGDVAARGGPCFRPTRSMTPPSSHGGGIECRLGDSVFGSVLLP